MNNKVLLPLFYLSPISWFSVFLNEENEIKMESFENFPKQTYRNRTVIYGANGKLSLIIPIKHTGKREIKDIEISYAEDWQKLHWKSIKTAYQSTPYFEYYEDKLKLIFEKKMDKLMEFNIHSLEVIQNILKTEKKFTFSKEYFKHPEQQNFRDFFSPKKESEIIIPEYYQSFSEKHGFLKDLSILDLICNTGPEAYNYLKKISIDKI